MLAVMQPTFFPWIGYFDLIDCVDNFIFLDDVLFSKQSWQQRNRVQGLNGLEWITVPVDSNGGTKRIINQVKISLDRFPLKIINKITECYKKYPYFEEYWSKIELIFDKYKYGGCLSEFNSEIIISLNKILGINTKIHFSSLIPQEFERIGDIKVDRLIGLINYFGDKEYLSTSGAKTYLEGGIGAFDKNNNKVLIQNYSHPNYAINSKNFYEGASIIDLIFTHGDASLEIIRSGRRIAWGLNNNHE